MLSEDRVFITSYPDTPYLRDKIIDKIYQITNKPNDMPFFIQGGSCSYHNTDKEGANLQNWPEFKDLVSKINEHLSTYLKQICIDDTPEFRGMWANRYPTNTFVMKHNHRLLGGEGFLMACLFYLQKPENSGNLVIEDKEINIQEGDIVIFESYKDHWTIPNKSEKDKLVIGMEYRVV